MTRLGVRRGSQDRGVSIELDDSTESLLWSETDDRRLKGPERRLAWRDHGGRV